MSVISRTGYGVDVGLLRADDLDKHLLAAAANHVGARVLDLGCGAGGIAARLHAAGAQVVGVDQFDFAAQWRSVGVFYQADVRDLAAILHGDQFDYCLCQRVLHYIPYEDACRVLRHIRHCVSKELYVSFSGMTSELARGYRSHEAPVEERHGLLAPAVQKTFGITAPVTLYHQQEAIKLVEQAGWRIDWVRTSQFGNSKIIASPY